MRLASRAFVFTTRRAFPVCWDAQVGIGVVLPALLAVGPFGVWRICLRVDPQGTVMVASVTFPNVVAGVLQEVVNLCLGQLVRHWMASFRVTVVLLPARHP